MRGVLLGLALTASIAAPAYAGGFSASGFNSSSGSHYAVPGLSGRPASSHSRHIHVGDGSGFGGWAYYDGDYDANRSFDPDKWNDWWHDRPDRAYPAWMRRNQDCSRVWYSGSELAC